MRGIKVEHELLTPLAIRRRKKRGECSHPNLEVKPT
jgi:hypothetical protein